ncbi:neutral zinc metallopeptidase [Sphingosinicella sp. BN140058]|uniref:KPN_02809 family neutral zinc metallopeptidase n=1 Tax=Sphingosinicella sp. BN140058 TaxID=1892855 RepID=UPI001013AAAD|nr:neutral zinc metallopeptidase [Sphingosinicella sp. BN140058]QAY76226.1 zinc metalloprotease [Sphingosinicella sp. BN140058]
MRLDDYRTSDNVSDQRGQSFGGGGFGGGGGGIFGLLFGLVLSRFGIGGVLILALGYCALTTLGGGGSLGVGGGTEVAPHQARGGANAQEACAIDPASKFSCQVLANTEDTWSRIFQAQGQRYQPAGFVFYGGRGQSGCGAAQSAMGPFYCPTDNRIYLDTSFYGELQNRFGAAGDFAQAYVIAHEVGHHLQFLTGTLNRAHEQQQSVSSREGNAIQVRVELQADCYAGVWAANAKDAQGRAALEPGDIEEGLRAAQAIGDDTLQRQAQGRVVPEAFTHGSAEQRQRWLRRGLESGDPASCDTFAAATV